MTESEAVKIVAGHALTNLIQTTMDVIGINGLTYESKMKILAEMSRIARSMDTQYDINYAQAYRQLTAVNPFGFGE